MKRIPLRNRDKKIIKWALVDDEDYPLISGKRWHTLHNKRNWYVLAAEPKNWRKVILMHRVILGAKKGEIIDHINNNGLDNRRSNLRRCTNSQNLMNSRISKRNTSGTKGVYWVKKDKVWRASVKVNRKVTILGQFKNLSDAVKARKEALPKYHGEFARLR